MDRCNPNYYMMDIVGMIDDLTDEQREIVATLPQPPEMAEIHVSNVWIVERNSERMPRSLLRG